MHRGKRKRDGPWKRVPATPNLSPCHLRYVREFGSTWPKFSKFDCNKYLDCDTIATVLNASPSVVALISFSGDVLLTRESGTIIEKHDDTIIVLTSANLIRQPTSQEFGENTLADNITVHTHLCGGDFCRDGKVYAYDFHYNLAVIRFSFIPPFGPAKVAKVAHIDDSIDVHSSQASQPHSGSYKLTPGNRVIVMGRYFAEPYEPMAAPGEYRLEKTSYDCKELLMTNCKITRCGDGGPLINSHGELIGIAFFDSVSTPCLPINIACKWWDHYKEYGKRFRPFLGFEATGLFAADLGLIERVIHNFPDTLRGLVVEKIIPDSSADLAGLRVDDVIIKCDGKPVQSFLELFEMLWEKVGVPIEMLLIRAGDLTHKLLKMVFVEGTSDQLNSWPVHDKLIG